MPRMSDQETGSSSRLGGLLPWLPIAAAILYAALRAGYTSFYGEFHVAPEQVGNNYISTLGGSVIGLSLLLITQLILTAIAALISLYPGSIVTRWASLLAGKYRIYSWVSYHEIDRGPTGLRNEILSALDNERFSPRRLRKLKATDVDRKTGALMVRVIGIRRPLFVGRAEHDLLREFLGAREDGSLFLDDHGVPSTPSTLRLEVAKLRRRTERALQKDMARLQRTMPIIGRVIRLFPWYFRDNQMITRATLIIAIFVGIPSIMLWLVPTAASRAARDVRRGIPIHQLSVADVLSLRGMPLIDNVALLDLRGEPARVVQVGSEGSTNDGIRHNNCLLYLGQSDQVIVFYDVLSKATIRVSVPGSIFSTSDAFIKNCNREATRGIGAQSSPAASTRPHISPAVRGVSTL
jgi:hypothetical protein